MRTYLILVDLTVLQFGLALLLEGDDDQGHENIDEEERKHDKVHNIKDGHLYAEILNWTLVFVCGSHRVLQHSVDNMRKEKIAVSAYVYEGPPSTAQVDNRRDESSH